MRKIEYEMVTAARNGNDWSKDNTRVHSVIGGMEVQLHGNILGIYECQGGGNFGFTVNKETLKKYPTNTTKSRLRALGVNVKTIKGVLMLDGVPV